MTWYANEILLRATPAALAAIEASAQLAPFAHHIRSLKDERWYRPEHAHGLPEGGLIVIQPVCGAEAQGASWHGMPLVDGSTLQLPEPMQAHAEKLLAPQTSAQLSEHLNATSIPALNLRTTLAALAAQLDEPVVYYGCSMWGGDIDYEYALIYAPQESVVVTDATEQCHDLQTPNALLQGLEKLGLVLPSPFLHPTPVSLSGPSIAYDQTRAKTIAPESQTHGEFSIQGFPAMQLPAFDHAQAIVLLKEKAKTPLSSADIAAKAHRRWDLNQHPEAALLFCLAFERAHAEIAVQPDSTSQAPNYFVRAAINFNMAGEATTAEPMLTEVTQMDWQKLGLPNDSHMSEWAFEQLLLNQKTSAPAFAALFEQAVLRCRELGWEFPKIHPKQELLLQTAITLNLPTVVRRLVDLILKRRPISRDTRNLLQSAESYLAQQAP